MKSDIEFLNQLEEDLSDAAEREAKRLRTDLQGAIRRNAGRTWTKVAGVAAAFLVVAGVIGFAAGGLFGSGDDGAAGRFQEVGDAVASNGHGDGGGAQPAAPAPAEEPSIDDDADGFAPGEGAPGVRGNVGQQDDLSKIVRDGRIGIVVADGAFGDAVGELTFIAERHGGMILSSSTNNERSGTFVLRIPARRFDRARLAIRDLALRVRFEEIRGEDVTAEFIDSQARLRILQARRALLFELFQRADTTDEILRMSGQLDDVTLRIEQIQGQLRFLNDQVARSTLRVTIQERNAPETAPPPDEVDNPDLGSAFDLAIQGFLRIVGAVIVGLGYLVPLTALALLAFGVVYVVRRRRATG